MNFPLSTDHRWSMETLYRNPCVKSSGPAPTSCGPESICSWPSVTIIMTLNKIAYLDSDTSESYLFSLTGRLFYTVTIIISPLPLPSSWFLRLSGSSLIYILKDSSSVIRYPFYELLTLTLAKEVQSFLALLGIYSGIFAMYLQCKSNEYRSTVFYVYCLLYFLSMATVVCDVLACILRVSDNSISKIIIMQMRIGALSPQLQNDSQLMLFRNGIVQTVLTGSCDFIYQCILVCMDNCTYHPFFSPKFSKIYRCWIVWGKRIRAVIIPSFITITYMGQ